MVSSPFIQLASLVIKPCKNGDCMELYCLSKVLFFFSYQEESSFKMSLNEWQLLKDNCIQAITTKSVNHWPTCILINDSDILSFGVYKPNQPKREYMKSRKKGEKPWKMLYLISFKNTGWSWKTKQSLLTKKILIIHAFSCWFIK